LKFEVSSSEIRKYEKAVRGRDGQPFFSGYFPCRLNLKFEPANEKYFLFQNKDTFFVVTDYLQLFF